MYTNKLIKKNEILNNKNIIPKRPGLGISPLLVDKLYGKKVKHDIRDDVLIRWKHIKN